MPGTSDGPNERRADDASHRMQGLDPLKEPTVVSRTADVTRAHAHSVKLSVRDIVIFLRDNLGTPVVALIAGVDRKTVGRWQQRDEPAGVRPESERRLRAAYQVFQLLQTVDAPPTVRAWFIGMNPQLEDESPAEALAAGKLREVMSAARAFVNGG